MSDAFTREPSWAPRLFPPAARAPRAVQTARMLLDPQGYARSLRRRFGPVFSLRTFPTAVRWCARPMPRPTARC